jgi:hypothetical protein
VVHFALPLLLLAGTPGTPTPAPAAPTDLESRLRSAPELVSVLDDAEELRLQIVVGLVERNENGENVLRQETFRAGEEYFYPASTVKLFAAIAAAQKITALRASTGLDLDLDTPMVYHPLFEDDVLEREDSDNVEGGAITVRQEIREIFLVSSNEAFNYLYEFAGQDGIWESLRKAGLESPRIVHRLSEFRSAEENRQLPQIDFAGNEFSHSIAARTTPPLPAAPVVAGLEVGKGYYRGEDLVKGPMNFSGKNSIPLVDLQRGLCMLVRPDVDCGGAGFELDPSYRAVMLEAMSQYPRESLNPVYDVAEYPDDYVKGLLRGVTRVLPKERVKIYNKTGEAYGFSTENAWVVDVETGQGFFLALTIYTNANGVLNDDDYEYMGVAKPFLVGVGEVVARWVWSE